MLVAKGFLKYFKNGVFHIFLSKLHEVCLHTLGKQYLNISQKYNVSVFLYFFRILFIKSFLNYLSMRCWYFTSPIPNNRGTQTVWVTELLLNHYNGYWVIGTCKLYGLVSRYSILTVLTTEGVELNFTVHSFSDQRLAVLVCWKGW